MHLSLRAQRPQDHRSTIMRRQTTALFFLIIPVLLAGCVATQPVSTRTLLAEMADLAALAEFPNPPYTCRQFSSYDRASTTPDNQKTWFANADVGQYLRVEERDGRKEYVMMDADGPGAIVRIWSANPKGTLRVYLDGRPQPALEVPLADLLGGKVAGVPEPIACTRSAGWSSYFPIPYARHCKVTSDEGGFYYHVNYRTYPQWTPVTTFVLSDLTHCAPEIAEVAAQLAAPQDCRAAATTPGPAAHLQDPPADGYDLLPGRSMPFEISGGPLALVELRVKVTARDREQALRHLLLTMEFDGRQTVVCPLGDFFGAGPGVHPYASLPLGITPDGELWSHWVMPFRKSVHVDIHNLGQDPARVALHVTPSAYRWTSRSMHFHAAWRVARDVPTRPFQDWNYLSASGTGVFVGAAFTLLNPAKAWWGEGDEKIYVDGEKFPSHFGTGTEDYYGYAWGSSEPFTHAYHNQPQCDGPGSYGRTAVNRWHIPDRIPFERRFRFDMELWHWWEGNLPEMSVATYWYARPGAAANRATPVPADLQVATLPPYVAPRVAGALEGEEMVIVHKTGEVTPQDIDGCSNERHLWWRGGQPGDKLVLSFSVPAAGKYRVWARLVKAVDYGIVQLAINDDRAGEPVDLYNKGVQVADEILLGTFTLRAGENQFTSKIVGANDEAVKGYMFGLDYLRLEPAD
jgi:hypothetical protein